MTIPHPPTVVRYSPAMQALHWIMAGLMAASLPLAWAMTSLPRTAPNREYLYTMHKSVGVLLGLLVIARLVLRATRPVPAELPGTAAWMALAAHVSHWALYAILIVMPISGYLISSAGGHEVSIFGLVNLPALPDNPALVSAARSTHQTVQWAVYGFLSLHVLATIWHVAVRRDGLLDRQLPAQVPDQR